MGNAKSGMRVSGVTKTFRNMQRLKEILKVFIKNGLEELVIKSRLHLKIPDLGLQNSRNHSSTKNESWQNPWKVVGHRLRLSFEELGPAFIKFGQILSTREDIFPKDFVHELKRLQDDVNPMSFAVAEKIIDQALGRPWREVFETIDVNVLASASIASVFKAVLKSGEVVVIKIKRPGIEKIIEQDFDLLSFIITRLEKLNREFRYLGLTHHLEDFYRTIKQECDLQKECRNLGKLKFNYQKRNSLDVLYFPTAYPEHSSSEILVIEFLDGIPFNKLTKEDVAKWKLEAKLHQCAVLFFQSLFYDGFFHADLHGGNFFYLPKSNQIGLLDFGLVGHLSNHSRQDLILILYFLITGNFQGVVHQFLDVAEYEHLPDIKQLGRDLEETLGPYVGLKVSEINVQELLKLLMGTLSKHEIFLPREWSTIFRAIITLDGLGRSIGFDLNTFEILEKELDQLKSSFLNKDSLMQDALGAGRQGINVLRTLPHHLSWYLRELSKRNYAFDVRNKDQVQAIKMVSSGLSNVGLGLMGTGFLLSATYMVPREFVFQMRNYPVMAIIFYLMGMGIFLLLLFARKKA